MGLISEVVAGLVGRLKSSPMRDHYVKVMIRRDIEQARQMLRLNDLTKCQTLLASAEGRIPPLTAPDAWALSSAASSADEPAGGEVPSESSMQLLRAVILTLRGQSAASRGLPDEAGSLMAEAVDLFGTVAEVELTPREHGDYGVALAATGRYREARRHLEAAVGADGAPPEHARELARTWLQLGRAAKAEKIVDETLLASPSDPELWLLRGEVSKQLKSPTAAEYFLEAGRIFWARQRDDEALLAFEEADTIDPGPATLFRAEALNALGRHQEAVEVYDAALTREHHDEASILIRRAAAYAALDAWERTGADIERALVLRRFDPDVLVRAGRLRLTGGDPEAAKDLATQALSIDRTSLEAVLLCSEADDALGGPYRALELLRQVAGESRAHPQILRHHAMLAQRLGFPAEGVERLTLLQELPQVEAGDAFALASALTDMGRLDEARAVTSRARSTWPDSLELRSLEVQLALDSGHHAQGAGLARELVELAPDWPTAHLLLAWALLGDDEDREPSTTEALAAVDRAAELAPWWAEPWWLRAQILETDHDGQGVRQAVMEVLDRDPQHPAGQRASVDLAIEDGDLDRAEMYARRLVDETFAEDLDAVVLLARVLFYKRDDEAALSLLDDARVETAGAPVDRAARLLLRARLRVAAWRLREADDDLGTAAQLAPEVTEVWTYRARVARMLGDGESAQRYAETALSIAPEDFGARTERAGAHLMLNEVEEADRVLVDLLGERPHDPEAGVLLAHALRARQPDEAKRQLAALADANPDNFSLSATLAQFELDDDEPRRALELLDQIPGADGDLDVLLVRAEALRVVEDFPRAIDSARMALHVAPTHPEALATLGLSLLSNGNDEESVEVLERATAEFPDEPLAKARLGHAYSFVDRYEDAVELLGTSALELPRDAWVNARLADLLAEIGMFGHAITYYRRACELEEHEAAAWDGLGWSLSHIVPPDWPSAKESFRKAISIASDPWTRKNLANALFAEADPEARALYEDVFEEAMRQRAEHVDFMSLAGWCAFRLRDLDTAARTLYEATTLTDRIGSDHFDLALVHVCDGRVRRGIDMYDRLMPLEGQDQQRRRGLLAVAMVDLRTTVPDYPGLQGNPELTEVMDRMSEAIASIPEPPIVGSLILGARSLESGE